MLGFYILSSNRTELAQFNGQQIYVIGPYCGSEAIADDELVASVNGTGIIVFESELDPTEYGIRNPALAAWGEEVVHCNDCNIFLYENSGDERDNNCLQMIMDDDAGYINACPCCGTDSALMNVSRKEIYDMIPKSLKKVTIFPKK